MTSKYPNLLTKLVVIEKNSFIMIVRQNIALSLNERFYIRPSLTPIEKEFLILQLLMAVYSVHKNNLFHGDIKSQNILLTTNNHLFLTDFATYKPLFLQEETALKDYNYFFSNENNRVCNIAPERIIQTDKKDQ